jgi:50S ribosomal protein L16 3-hydroxylase
VSAEGQYGDPGAPPARHPGALPPKLVDHAERTLRAVRWDRGLVRDFAGRYLSEPKAHVFFEPPARPLGRAAFARAAARRGLALDLRTRLLFSGSMFYVNGEAERAAPAAARKLRDLADRRELHAPLDAPRAFWDIAHTWYARGFLHLKDREET